MSDPFLSLARDVQLATDALDAFDPESLKGLDREDLMSLLVLLEGPDSDEKGLAGRVSLIASSVKSELASLMESDEEQVGDYLIERRMGKSRSKWDHQRVWGALESYVVEAYGHPALAGLDAARTAAPSPSWTAGGLRRLSLNPDAYCEPGEVRTSLVVRRHIAQEGAA